MEYGLIRKAIHAAECNKEVCEFPFENAIRTISIQIQFIHIIIQLGYANF